MNLKAILLSFLFVPHLLLGQIIETDQFQTLFPLLEQHRAKKTLIVCDIDNTLLTVSQQLGGVAWGDYMIAQLEGKGISTSEAHLVEHIYWKAVQPYIPVETVDPQASNILSHLQNQNFPVIGLTARFPDEVDYTIEQVNSIGIYFSDLARPQLYRLEKQDALFTKGILFATPLNKKSDVLFAFLDQNQLSFDKIIFLDDKLGHVEQMERACEERQIAYVGIRFSGADDRVRNFDPQLAEIEWGAFPQILSDAQAEHIRTKLFSTGCVEKVSLLPLLEPFRLIRQIPRWPYRLYCLRSGSTN